MSLATASRRSDVHAFWCSGGGKRRVLQPDCGPGNDKGFNTSDGGVGSLNRGGAQRGFNLYEVTTEDADDIWNLRLQDVATTTPPVDTDATFRELVIKGIFSDGQQVHSIPRTDFTFYQPESIGVALWRAFGPAGSNMVVGNSYDMDLLP